MSAGAIGGAVDAAGAAALLSMFGADPNPGVVAVACTEPMDAPALAVAAVSVPTAAVQAVAAVSPVAAAMKSASLLRRSWLT